MLAMTLPVRGSRAGWVKLRRNVDKTAVLQNVSVSVRVRGQPFLAKRTICGIGSTLIIERLIAYRRNTRRIFLK